MKELKQVAVRLVDAPPLYSDKTIAAPKDAVDCLAKELRQYDREVFVVINLSASARVINFSIVAMGDLNNCIVHPREVLKSAILSNAGSIICMHNHPSGNAIPSKFDIEATSKVKYACDIMGIHLNDHIIVGTDYFSFLENEML